MNPWINYHHLYYFKVIATEGGVARAAEKLRLGQPTLSAQLKSFEESLGVQLFERHHKKLVLTESGRMALKYAQDIFRMGSEMYETLHDQMAQARVHVQIGALDSVPKIVQLKLIEEALKITKCTVSMLEGKADELIRELGLNRIDMFVANFSPYPTEGIKIYSRQISKRPVAIYGAKKFKNLQKAFPNSLAGQPLALPTIHSKLRSDLDHYFSALGVSMEMVAETQDTSLLKLLAVSGRALVPLSEISASELIDQEELVKIGPIPGVYEDMYLVASNRKIENPVSAKLMKDFHL